MTDDAGTVTIAPGTYRRGELPPMSGKVQAMWDELQRAAAVQSAKTEIEDRPDKLKGLTLGEEQLK